MTSPVWDEKGRTHNTGGSTRSGWSNPRIRAASPYPTHVVCRHVQTWRSAPRPVREPGPTQPRHPPPHGKTAEDAVLQEANGPASAGWWPPHQCAAPGSPPARGGTGAAHRWGLEAWILWLGDGVRSMQGPGTVRWGTSTDIELESRCWWLVRETRALDGGGFLPRCAWCWSVFGVASRDVPRPPLAPPSQGGNWCGTATPGWADGRGIPVLVFTLGKQGLTSPQPPSDRYSGGAGPVLPRQRCRFWMHSP